MLRYNAIITTKQGIKLYIAVNSRSVRSFIVLTALQHSKALQGLVLQRFDRILDI